MREICICPSIAEISALLEPRTAERAPGAGNPYFHFGVTWNVTLDPTKVEFTLDEDQNWSTLKDLGASTIRGNTRYEYNLGAVTDASRVNEKHTADDPVVVQLAELRFIGTL